jgi:hypothetical protein
VNPLNFPEFVLHVDELLPEDVVVAVGRLEALLQREHAVIHSLLVGLQLSF